MLNIPDKYINLISSVPYNVSKHYGIPYDVVINYIKKFRKRLKVEDFVEFIIPTVRTYNRLDDMDIGNKISLLNNIFSEELSFIFDENQVLEMSKSFRSTKLFINFMNVLTNDIFVGVDVDDCKSMGELLSCRSYKIYLLLNEEVCSN